MSHINPDRLAEAYRSRVLNLEERRIQIARVGASTQQADLSVPANAQGFGRIRHFRRMTSEGWPENPLPIDPACHFLKLNPPDSIESQLYQVNACNIRCWYCFVPYDLLAAKSANGAWFTAHQLIEYHLSSFSSASVIVLSGGEPSLVPEWALWMAEALQDLGQAGKIYLWGDDNLLSDFFWTKLTPTQQSYLANYPGIGKVGCIKGFDEASFAFNTGADGTLFNRQLEILGRYVATGIDVYGYITLTCLDSRSVASGIPRLFDRLQLIHPELPLRIVPLEIQVWGPTSTRLDENRNESMKIQNECIRVWMEEINGRFTPEQKTQRMHNVMRKVA